MTCYEQAYCCNRRQKCDADSFDKLYLIFLLALLAFTIRGILTRASRQLSEEAALSAITGYSKSATCVVSILLRATSTKLFSGSYVF